MATTCVEEVLPPVLDSTSDQPPLFDGTTRLYISYSCPFAQRVWITRNYKGLQEQIKLVPLNLQNRPAWYKEKVYPGNKVPALEHNNKVIGESLDLIKYVDSNFGGPSLCPDGPGKREFAEELISYTDTFIRIVYTSFKGDPAKEVGATFDHLETALHKFDDGPFFLGQFSLVDIASIPFVEKFQIFLSEVWKYDITAGRPKLAAWIEVLSKTIQLCGVIVMVPLGSSTIILVILILLQELNKIGAYKQTKCDPKVVVEAYTKLFLVILL
ncbi:Glutathione S-transferase L3 [Vitis vinifera]|uniref:Glutathione S-transferase L3 n=1 Tax=Vitis vinifera TaxID=29760 RepID=A0A438IQ26_VITVI|nr:Glutathione S-transferase L3 [Vitis vinifera]